MKTVAGANSRAGAEISCEMVGFPLFTPALDIFKPNFLEDKYLYTSTPVLFCSNLSTPSNYCLAFTSNFIYKHSNTLSASCKRLFSLFFVSKKPCLHCLFWPQGPHVYTMPTTNVADALPSDPENQAYFGQGFALFQEGFDHSKALFVFPETPPFFVLFNHRYIIASKPRLVNVYFSRLFHRHFPEKGPVIPCTC